MTKTQIFKTIKEANGLADELKKYEVGSKEYNEISQAIGWTLDSLIGGKGFSLHHSERTGHYWVKFSYPSKN